MTSIDFYTHCADRLQVAARLVAKAWAAHGSVRVLTPDAAATDELDRRLWQWPATGFLPHCRLAHPLADETPIIVDHSPEHRGRADVLINLQAAPPPFFARFERLVEIVSVDDDAVAAGRERWRYYKSRGYELKQHNLAEREASAAGSRP
ncbi:MAG: DNA polymerase III subunit chi [Betaproteobacteria bacterium]|jgi:DNA polymerase-3 subunit chi|nr:DNA polymerase III subunit chi [Betaproteobacteria bacterium]MBK6602043.1 DNA polymerase III subunit chi [Betaproteobacteria bacterium]MBK7082813.1 DNA polymerase III subunit chi [Betaproteobacteria bacterium]MBK7591977.1 DNA polymerase III subunit chi [Betaproteobacteria bacterium]MBK7745400.1 DNA polymerase III subunit chi [Betaproteobacteria bacterium]